MTVGPSDNPLSTSQGEDPYLFPPQSNIVLQDLMS